MKLQTDLKNEFKQALESEAHFETLREAVVHVTGMFVSQSASELSAKQTKSLQAIFGDSAVLHTLRQRLQESEQHGNRLQALVLDLKKAAQQLRLRLVDIWEDLKKVASNFNEVPLDEINHYQVLVVKNLLVDKYGDSAKLAQADAQIESDVRRHTELNKEVQTADLLEELSRKNATELSDYRRSIL